MDIRHAQRERRRPSSARAARSGRPAPQRHRDHRLGAVQRGLGRVRPRRIAAQVKEWDPTRLVDADSGVNCCYSIPDSGEGDVYDDHTYVGPGHAAVAERPHRRRRRVRRPRPHGRRPHDSAGPKQAYEMEPDSATLTSRYVQLQSGCSRWRTSAASAAASTPRSPTSRTRSTGSGPTTAGSRRSTGRRSGRPTARSIDDAPALRRRQRAGVPAGPADAGRRATRSTRAAAPSPTTPRVGHDIDADRESRLGGRDSGSALQLRRRRPVRTDGRHRGRHRPGTSASAPG